MERPSQYLVDKCKSLEQAILFFSYQGPSSTGVVERRLTFLAQIDFWEWEMDEMIYAVESFQDRSQAWDAGKQGVDQMLRQKGIVVKKNKLWDGLYNRGWIKRYRKSVVAPIQKANGTIERWNNLLRACESLLQKDLQQYGVNAMDNLDKFKKSPIPIPELPKEGSD